MPVGKSTITRIADSHKRKNMEDTSVSTPIVSVTCPRFTSVDKKTDEPVERVYKRSCIKKDPTQKKTHNVVFNVFRDHVKIYNIGSAPCPHFASVGEQSSEPIKLPTNNVKEERDRKQKDREEQRNFYENNGFQQKILKTELENGTTIKKERWKSPTFMPAHLFTLSGADWVRDEMSRH
jgi:hypothetical protein